MYSLWVWIGMCRLVHLALADLPVKISCHVLALENLLRLRQRFHSLFFFIIILFITVRKDTEGFLSTRIFKSDEKLRSVSSNYNVVFFVIVRGGN